VEFVLDADGRFWFLEVNTRLQVEHPVTEEVTGLDLVALQLAVAAGEPLPPEATSPRLAGHAIEARLYAEDVPAGFLPVSGTVHLIAIPGVEGIRVESGVEDGSQVSTHYDAMIAKVIASGPTRRAAAGRLADALARARIHGLVTNRDLLVGILRHPEFLDGRTDTDFLTRHDPTGLGTPPGTATRRRLHASAAALANQARRRRQAVVQPAVPSGWRNVGPGWQQVSMADASGPLSVAYRMTGEPAVTVDGEPVEPFELVRAGPHAVEMVTAGTRRLFRVARYGPEVWVDSPLGSSAFTEVGRFPLPGSPGAAGSLLAPMPGAVVRVPAVLGAAVAAGDVLVVLEAMKMEHPVRAPHAGTVHEIRVVEGQRVETGTVLVVLEDPGQAPRDREPGG
jgi:acyl-CoA carboxylase subunit alpha